MLLWKNERKYYFGCNLQKGYTVAVVRSSLLFSIIIFARRNLGGEENSDWCNLDVALYITV